MTIQERTINVTYKNTTRPISFVYNDSYSKISQFQITARVLYEFKDLIPDYQMYSEMKMSLDIYKDTEASLELPTLQVHFTVITIGHGTIEFKIDNPYCMSVWSVGQIKDELERQIGITKECIELCNEEGEEFINTLTYDNNKMTLYAVIKSFEDEVLEKGYEILDYKSVFKAGETMRLRVLDVIGNYRIIKFYPELGLISKRTPKTVVDENNVRKKIHHYLFGEGLEDSFRDYIVSKIGNIEYNKLYAIAV